MSKKKVFFIFRFFFLFFFSHDPFISPQSNKFGPGAARTLLHGEKKKRKSVFVSNTLATLSVICPFFFRKSAQREFLI